jgi:hypothetical protein
MLVLLKFRPVCGMALLFLWAAYIIASDSQLDNKNVPPATKETVVRFYYQVGQANFYLPPLIFRAVNDSDVRLGTAPILSEGRTVFISFSELQHLIASLDDLPLSWQKKQHGETPQPSNRLAESPNLEITIFGLNETVQTTVLASHVCETLAPLEHGLIVDRALWEFKLYQFMDGCKVADFIPDKYPGHWYE